MMQKPIVLLILCALTACQSEYFRDEIPGLLGVSDVKIERNEGVDEFAGFGESYTLEIYTLSHNTILAFENRGVKTLPDKHDERFKWKKLEWTETPLDSGYSELIAACLHYMNGDKKMEDQLLTIKKVVNEGGAYVSSYFYPSKEAPDKAQMFILDPRTRTLYVIDSRL